MTSTPEHETPEHETPENETAEIDLSAAAEVAVDARLIEAHDLALAALHEITPASTVGAPAGYTLEDDGAVSLRFANTMPGYPNWFWTVSVAAVEGAEPTVLEAELLPGEGALLAPEWVPWAERLAEYQAAQAALAAEQGDAEASDALDDTDEADDVDDLDDLDAADFDEDGSPILHAGDVDGVDIDELDEDAEEDDDEDDDDEAGDDSDDDEDAEDEADED
ncbi:DUF3027 domain-containing protein [uncultured Microbacterium sp.]|uniref:DUF3027 domain-containing protein n=1 Tax=uncultured Microbacterium sp. TaxID=191216 RepID=UPI0028ECBB2B|nr:DUF3027 domain-containing protein [uncultured Microbacterium sp.]